MENKFNLSEKEIQDLINHGFATVEGVPLSTIARILGRKGGQSTSEAKCQAAITNGKLGGRPKKVTQLAGSSN